MTIETNKNTQSVKTIKSEREKLMKRTTIDSIVASNVSVADYASYKKRVKTYDELCSYVNENVTDISVYYNIEMKKLKNNSLAIKFRDQNKRICRIDSAYDEIRITTDRLNHFAHLKYDEHVRRDCRVYATILLDEDEFTDVFMTICKNASITE